MFPLFLHPLRGRPVGSAQALEQLPQIFQLPLVVFVFLELAFVGIVGLFNPHGYSASPRTLRPGGAGLLAGVVSPAVPAVLVGVPHVLEGRRVDHHCFVAAEEFRHFGVTGNLGVRLPVGGLRLLVPERLCALLCLEGDSI